MSLHRVPVTKMPKRVREDGEEGGNTPKRKRPTTRRAWCFTFNSEVVWTDLMVVGFWREAQLKGARRLVCQSEKGAEGHHHLQGTIVFYEPVTMSICLSLWKGHWEHRKSKFQSEAEAYCMKPETRVAGPWVFGDPIAEGAERVDMQKAQADLDAGMSMRQFAQKHFTAYVRYGRGFRDYVFQQKPNRNWLTTVTVYWGAPGTGKSRRAAFEAGDDAFWLPKPDQNGMVWWDGYENQKHVVIDEFYGWLPRDFMQRLIDRYPLQVQTKGGMTRFLAERVWVTSNQDPVVWWKIGLGAMERRLLPPNGQVILMNGPEVYTPPVNGAEVTTAPDPVALELVMLQPEFALYCDEHIVTDSPVESANLLSSIPPLVPVEDEAATVIGMQSLRVSVPVVESTCLRRRIVTPLADYIPIETVWDSNKRVF